MLQFRTLEIGRRLTVKIETQRLPEDRFSNLAPFSSIGPTSDGRIKPDVVAPGVTVSAGKSSKPDECTQSVLHGTSMATPLVGGGAAIVRQYFLEGWYPTGTSNTQLEVRTVFAYYRSVARFYFLFTVPVQSAWLQDMAVLFRLAK